MRRCGRLVGVVALVAVVFSRTAEADDAFEEYGDIFQFVLPISGFVATYVAKDKPGRVMFLKQGGWTMGTVSVLKLANEKWRPNAGNAQSFPSGHTAGAFWGASFLGRRYGPAVGVPSYILAALVGVSRVDSQNHFMDDVVSGMSIALFSSWLVTTPMSSSVALQPIHDSRGYGLSLDFGSLNLAAPDDAPPGWKRSWRYSWEFGGSFTDKVEVTAPKATGTTFDIAEFVTGDEEQVTGMISLEYFGGEGHEVLFRFFPYEVRDLAVPPQPITFVGTTFPAGTLLLSAYRLYELKFRWRFDVIPSDGKWNFKLGAGITFQDTTVELESTTQFERTTDFTALPILHVHVAYNFSPKWKLFAEVDGMAIGDASTIDSGIFLQWQIDHHWDLSIGYRFWDRDIDTTSLVSDFQMQRGVLGVGYTW